MIGKYLYLVLSTTSVTLSSLEAMFIAGLFFGSPTVNRWRDLQQNQQPHT